MRSFVRPVVSATMLLAFVACSDDVTGPKTVGEARELWQAKNISTYTYVATHACFCGFPSGPGPVTVEVTQGHVSRVIVLATGAEVSSSGWYTIDELFNQISAATALRPPLVFDAVLGYPRRFERCCIEDDSGSIYTASTLISSS